MTRRRTSPPDKIPTVLAVPLIEAKERIAEQLRKGNELLNTKIETEEELTQARDNYTIWRDFTKEVVNQIVTTDELVLDFSHRVLVRHSQFRQKIADFQRELRGDLTTLSSINERLELYPVSDPAAVSAPAPSGPSMQHVGSQIFIVHGHDKGARESVARFITTLGLEPVILNEEPHQGETLIEKLDRYRKIDYALVLLTPDDVGGVKNMPHDELKLRARQNVVFELGFFIGALGRSHVCTLYKTEIEMPTDYTGTGYIPMDAGDGWKLGLARELKAAGFNIDMNKVL